MDNITRLKSISLAENIHIEDEAIAGKNNHSTKSTFELTAEEEKQEAFALGDAYFITQKISGKFPTLVSIIHEAIVESHDSKKGSLTVAIKNQNNSLREVKNITGNRGRHATSNIINISKVDAFRINSKLKNELKDNFSRTGDLLNQISEDGDDTDELIFQLSEEVKKWELTPKIRGLLFIEIRKITSVFRSLDMRGKRLIRSKSRLRYESVVIDLIRKNQLPGLDKKHAATILGELAREINELENLCGRNISLVIDDISQLATFDKKLISAQNKLVLSSQKYINYIVNTHARKNGLSDSERDDILQDMVELVISQALYHFDGSFKLSTYISRYFDQCKYIHNKKREIIPLRAKITKHARLYYESKRKLEQDGGYVTSQQIADEINKKNAKAKATCESVDELFGLSTLSLDTSFANDEDGTIHEFVTNENNISQATTHSPLYNIEGSVSHNQLEKKIYQFITDSFSLEYAKLYAMRYGFFSNQQATFERLVIVTGYSKDILRRRFIEISEVLQKEFHESFNKFT